MFRKSLLTVPLLLLLLGATAVLAYGSQGPLLRLPGAGPGTSQGGGYTLDAAISPLENNRQEPAAQGVLQGNGYALLPSPLPSIPTSAPASAMGVVTRTVSVNPGAFLYDQDTTDIQMIIYYGLLWAANTTERAGFYMARPGDWDGQSPVTARITFALGNSDAGAVNWRLRLNPYTPNSGEWITNPASRDADDILVFASGPSSLRIYDQTFTLQPEDFNDEPYWSFFFSRGDATNGETFAENLFVMGVDVIYQTVP